MSYSTQYCPAFVGSLTSGTSFGAKTVGRDGWRLSRDGDAGGGLCNAGVVAGGGLGIDGPVEGVAGAVEGMAGFDEEPEGSGFGVMVAGVLSGCGLAIDGSWDKQRAQVNTIENRQAVDRRIHGICARVILLSHPLIGLVQVRG